MKLNYLLIDVKATSAGSYMKMFIFKSNSIQIHEVAMHFAKTRRWIPSGSS